MVSDIAFTYHLYIPCGETFSFVPRSRSFVSVKVKISRSKFGKQKKKGRFMGIHVEQTHLVFLKIDDIDSQCNRICTALTTDHCFDDKSVREQPVAWKEYCAVYMSKKKSGKVY